MTGLTREQVEQLLRPINERRVGRRDGMSHLEAYDVRAHLDRIFGFGGWSGDVTDMTLLYEDEKTLKSGKPGYSVAYRCTYRLTIHATGATYTETATGDGQMPDFKRADAHDFAIKTAESQAFKRCAINLGDQFGLSLYQQGSTAALVGRTLAMPAPQGATPPTETPVDSHVTAVAPEDSPAQEADTAVETSTRPAADTPPGQVTNAPAIVADIREKALADGVTKRQLAVLVKEAGEQKVSAQMTTDERGRGMTLETFLMARIKDVA